jgi:two-component system, cell cycle response regulator
MTTVADRTTGSDGAGDRVADRDPRGAVLVVDDSRMDRTVLARAVGRLGYDVHTAEGGRQAVLVLRDVPAAHAIDVVLLDLLMPDLDGFGTLEQIKAVDEIAHTPVIVVSGLDDHASLVRCIELGATDFLYKPVDRELLRARLATSLASKRLRDVELDHLQQVGRVIQAANGLEAGDYDPAALEPVAARDDALGTLARVFDRMAGEVLAREENLRRQVEQLRIEIDRGQVDAQAAEVTGSDYYRRLAGEAASLKRILTGGDEPA